MESSQLLSILTWGLGICVTGFFFLVGWIIKINIELQQRVTFKWIEEKFEKDIKSDLAQISGKLDNMTNAIIGTMDKPGVIAILHEHGQRIASLESANDK